MKILASDFDNTLFFSDGVHKEDVEAIRTFQKQGNLFGLCTGRQLEGIKYPFGGDREHPLTEIDFDFYITLSGGVIFNKKEEIIFEKSIPMNIVREISEVIPVYMSIVYKDEIYMYRPKGEIWGTTIDSLDELSFKDTDAFSFHFPEGDLEDAKRAMDYINKHYSDTCAAFQNKNHVDVCGVGCSKGTGVNHVVDYFNINESDVYGIGDSWNDLPLLDSVKHGYTFTYAPNEVKDKAEKVVESLSEAIQDILKED